MRLGLGGLFLLAAYHKLFASPNSAQLFSDSVKAFHPFDFGFIPPAARSQLILAATFISPWTEIVAGLALILGLWTRAAAAALGALLVLFIFLIARAMFIGLELECGCFGKLSPFCPKKIGPCNIIQNSIMLAAALAIMLTPRHALTLDRLFRRQTDRAGPAA
jgi:uncharacterized membrane protein YphA (DoxX/SURF4 family)